MTDTTRPTLLAHAKAYLGQAVAKCNEGCYEDFIRWEEFFKLYNRILYSYAKKLRCQNDVADDVVAEVWKTVCEKLPEFKYDKQRGKFRVWLFTIIKYKAKHEFRRRAKHLGHAKDNTPPDHWTTFIDPKAKSPADIYDQLLHEEMAQAIFAQYRREAPEKELTYFEQCFMKGEKAAEVARRLHVSDDSIRQSLKRARLRLKIIAKEMFGIGDQDDL